MKIIKTFLVIPFLFILIGMAGCEDEKDEYSDFLEGYVVGTFIYEETGNNGQSTGNRLQGYCILIEGSKNIKSHIPIDFYTFNLPDNIFDFPEELSGRFDCGPHFFPDDVKYSYKIRFKYRILGKTEKTKFDYGCITLYPPFPWDNYREISLKDVIKN